ncbi:hypothetical protein J6590_001428 [Homalodisca vitripennis]|nr:hypothetical protein J6590_001428 [Homalodisca vitripennis]
MLMSGEESADLEALINQIVNDCILAVEEENACLTREKFRTTRGKLSPISSTSENRTQNN